MQWTRNLAAFISTYVIVRVCFEIIYILFEDRGRINSSSVTSAKPLQKVDSAHKSIDACVATFT
jgi:hypothetical protein